MPRLYDVRNAVFDRYLKVSSEVQTVDPRRRPWRHRRLRAIDTYLFNWWLEITNEIREETNR